MSYIFQTPFFFLGVVVVAGIMFEAYKQRLRHKERMQSQSAPDHGLLARIDKLEARVRVLERLATDKSHNLAEEIDSLRERDDRPYSRESF